MHRPAPPNADEDPLPSFEKRQVIANQLNMTPRSVQIWFQNRRQRLLKPLRQAEGTWGHQSDGIGHGSPRSIETAVPSPREMPNDNGAYSVNEHHPNAQSALAAAAAVAHEQQQQAYPVLAQFLARNLSAAIQFEAERGGRSPGASAQQRVEGSDAQAAAPHPYPINKEIDLESTLAALPHAVAAGHVDPSAAALLAQALQQQMVRAPMSADGVVASPLPPFLEGAGRAAHSPHSTAPPSTSATPAKAASDSSALDGLLLLSACAGAAVPAESSPLADAPAAEHGAAPGAAPDGASAAVTPCPAAATPSPADPDTSSVTTSAAPAAASAHAAASAPAAPAPIASPALTASAATSQAAEAPAAAATTQGALVQPPSLTTQGPLFQGVAPLQGVALLPGVTLPGPAYMQGVTPLRQGVALAPAPSLVQGVRPPLAGPACLPGGTPLQGLAQAHGCVVPLQGTDATPVAAEPTAVLPQAVAVPTDTAVDQERAATFPAEGPQPGLSPMWLSSLPSLQQAQLKAHASAQQPPMTQPAPYLSATPNPSVEASEKADDTESTSSDGPSSVGTSAPDAAGNNGGAMQTVMAET